MFLLFPFPTLPASAGAPGAPELPGTREPAARPGIAGESGRPVARAIGGGLRAARFSRAFLRFSIRFSFSSMRTVMNFKTKSATRNRRSTSLTVRAAQ